METKMLESIHISGFRKYNDLTLENFGRINFILGNNNVGKTSILEAIFVWACGQNLVPLTNIPLARCRYTFMQQPYWIIEEILSIANNRKDIPLHMKFSGVFEGKTAEFNHTIYPSELLTDFDSSYKQHVESIVPIISTLSQDTSFPTFPGFQATKQATSPQIVIAKWNVEFEGNIATTIFTVPQTQIPTTKPYRLAKFIDLLSHTGIVENTQIYSTMKREGRLDELTKEIKKVFTDIAGFDIIPYPDGSPSPINVIREDGTYLPMYAYGDGIQRWFYIFGAITLYKDSILCIDEIDTGFHPNAQRQLCKHLVQYAEKNNVQLFMTTHNIEFIDEFLIACNQLDERYAYDARIITLRETNIGLKNRTLTAQTALQARMNNRVDLR